MRILVAVDGSECSDYLVEHIVNRPWAEDDSFKVIMVALAQAGMMISGVSIGTVELPEEIEQARVIAERNAKKIQDALDNSVEYEVLTGFAAETICSYAESEGFDLILMGSHGRTGLVRLVMGSVAEAVLKKSPCSVEVIKHPGLEDEDDDDD